MKGLREQPHNIEAEQALLGAILVNNEAYHQVAGFLLPGHFYEPVHAKIYEAMARRIKAGELADPVLLWQLFEEDDKLSQIEGGARGYLEGMARSAEAIINADDYGRLVRNLAVKRALVRIGEDTTARAYNGYDTTADQMLADVQADLERLKADAGAPVAMPPLRAVAADELTTLEMPPREPVLGPWLSSKSLCMIYAPRGEGKTYIALGVALAAATGGRFLCWEAPAARNCLYIDGEMPAEALQGRLQALMGAAGITTLPTLRILTPDLQERPMPDLASKDGQAEIEHLVDWADVVVVDNLACLCRSGDENDRAPWLVTQGWLLAQRSRGKTILLIHHSGKGGDQRGTSSREDVLDAVVRLRRPRDYREEDGLRAEWAFTKHRGFFGADAAPLEVQLISGEHGDLTWTWQPLETSLITQVADLLNDADLSIRDVAQELDISKSRVSRLKSKAEAMGLLKGKKKRDS